MKCQRCSGEGAFNGWHAHEMDCWRSMAARIAALEAHEHAKRPAPVLYGTNGG